MNNYYYTKDELIDLLEEYLPDDALCDIDYKLTVDLFCIESMTVRVG